MSDLVALVRALVAIPSVNPTLAGGVGEGEIAAWLRAWLAARGLAVTMHEAAPGRPNVVAHLPGRGEAAPLLLNAHLDTVGIEGMAAPFTLRHEGDRLYGRGSYDMKGSVAILMALAAHFAAAPPPGALWFTWVSDEEDLSVGTEALVRDWLPTLPQRPVAALVVEPTEEAIAIAHKGFAWCEMRVAGRAGHGSRPDDATDAILPLGAALARLAELERRFVAGPRHPLLGRPSLHASTVQGGSAWSVYPAEATLRWERRTVPGETRALLEAEVQGVVAAAAAVNGAEPRGAICVARAPLQTAPEAALVQALRAAAPGAGVGGVSFWTDGALLSEAGIPTAIFGPIGHGAHAVDEWVSAASLARVQATLQTLIERGITGR